MMRAAVLHAPMVLRVEDVPVPTVETDEVLIAPHSVGICGTDLAVYRGHLAIPRPLVLGHEFSGVVTEVGSEVVRVKVGDRVTVEPSWGCGECIYCRGGWALHCVNKSSMGRTVDGALAELVKAPERVVHHIDDVVSFDEAQSTPTIASAVRAMTRLGTCSGATMAIMGAGHAGLILLQLCRLAGASTLFVVGGTREYRLRMAEELGADITIGARDRQQVEKTVFEVTGGLGLDVAIDAVGVPASVKQAMELVRCGATILLFGVYESPIDGFQAVYMYRKELTLIGSKGGFESYPEAIDLLKKRKLQIVSLISHFLPLNEVHTAFKVADGTDERALRVVIQP